MIAAAQIHIPWDAHERKQIAKRLSLDGFKVPAIAEMLSASERAVREWTQETRASNADVERAAQIAEAVRLRDLGLSDRKIAEQFGVSPTSVGTWLGEVSSDGGTAATGHGAKVPAEKPSRTLDDATLAAEADAWIAAGDDGSQKAFIAHVRERHGVGVHTKRAGPALEAARGRATVLGTPEPEPTPEPKLCPTCGAVMT